MKEVSCKAFHVFFRPLAERGVALAQVVARGLETGQGRVCGVVEEARDDGLHQHHPPDQIGVRRGELQGDEPA